MAAPTAPRPRKAAATPPPRPSRDANFMPKRERKRVRKSMIRAYVANKVSDVRDGARTRAEFYRSLRVMKQRRLLIAKEMHVLFAMVQGALSKAGSVANRVEDLKAGTDTEAKILNDLVRSADEAVSVGHAAASSVSTAADEFQLFAKQRIYFTEAVN